MPVDKYQKIIVRGSATIYLTLRIKFKSRKKFPANPHPSEIAFKIISLESPSVKVMNFICISHQYGSGMPTPFSSAPSGSCPSSGKSALHFVTRAEMDRTFARGPIVAAMRGKAVDATHQSLLIQGSVCKVQQGK